MKIQLSSAAFVAACDQANRLVSDKSPLPILSNLRFDVSNSSLQIMGSTPDISFCAKIDAEIDGGEASFCLNPKYFLSAAKELPEQMMTIEMDDLNLEAVFSYNEGKGNFHLIGESTDAYPLRPELKDAHSFTIKGEVLKSIVEIGLIAVAEDDLRPVMNGIYFDCKEEFLVAAASDSKKLIRIIRKDVVPGFEGSFILPKTVASFLKKFPLKKDADYTVSFDDKSFVIEGENVRLNARAIEGRFPRYDIVIPKNNNIKVTLDRATFKTAVRRVSCFSNKVTQTIALDFQPLGSMIEAQDIDTSSKGRENLDVEYPYTPIKIGFRADFLEEALEALAGAKDVDLCMADPARAAILVPSVQEENSEVLVLLMPLMLID